MRRNIHPYLSDPLIERFKAYCAATGATESSVAEAALQQFLDDSKDFTLVMRRLDRMGRTLGRLERDLGMLSEAFSVFVQLWFAHTPKIAEVEKDASKRQAWDRYLQYVDFVASKLSTGHRFIDDLVQDDIADTTELAEAVSASGDRP
jgi:hypothetical protein